ncbi:MAG: Trm112 family protein [Mesorhizobium sp.]
MKRTSKSKVVAHEQPMDIRMLEMLACPLTKGPLIWDSARSELVSRAAKLAYPVRDGIPVMLPSEARPVDDD